MRYYLKFDVEGEPFKLAINAKTRDDAKMTAWCIFGEVGWTHIIEEGGDGAEKRPSG